MELLFLNIGTFGMIVLIILILTAILLPIIAIVDVVRNRSMSLLSKLLWIVLVIFAPYLGAIIYFIAGTSSAP